MKEEGKSIQEPQVLEGEILPPIKPEKDVTSINRNALEDPTVNVYFFTQVNKLAPTEPDEALSLIVNFAPEAKHPIEELFETATEGLLKGTDKAVRGAVGLVNYRSLNRQQGHKRPTPQEARKRG